MNNNLEYQVIKLPSKCIPYKDVDPASIQIRPLKAKDEALIAEINDNNIERKTKILFDSVLLGIKSKDLTLGDRLYLLLWEMMNSYNDEIEVQFVCDTCFEKIRNYPIKISEINSVELSDSYEEPYTINLSCTNINTRLMRISDEIEIALFTKSKNNTYLYQYALTIIDDKLNTLEKVKILEELDTKDLAKIRAFHEQFAHGPDMIIKYVCPICNEEGSFILPFQFSTFFPQGEALIRNFGNRV